MVKRLREHGSRVIPHTTVKGVANVLAYVNFGRWLVDCPACGSGLQLDRGVRVPQSAKIGGAEPVITVKSKWILRGDECLACGTALKVRWPKAPDLIDAAMSHRPLLVNRNWRPGETVADLLAENGRHL